MKILIIEDNRVYSSTIKKNLEKKFIFAECDIVDTFEKLKKAELNYDLYVCDYMLPDSQGNHIEYLLQKEKNIIIMTGVETLNFSQKLKDKVIDYIVKDDFSTIEYLMRLIRRIHKNPEINILLVEDSASVRKWESNILKKMFFNVFEAENAKEALEIFEKENIDAVVTDLVMPDMDGIALIKNLRKKKKMNELPIVAVSSSEDKSLFLKSLKIGANDYLKKPFEKEELSLRINNLLDFYDSYKKISKELIKDALTDVYNRYYLENILENTFNGYEQKALAMLDIDFFKKINDTYGHQKGDEILKHFADTIKKNVRKSDIVIRYGGEEFLIFMPNTSKIEALIALLKVKKALNPYKGIKYTFSAGIADEGESLAEMIKIADKRLYEAKKSGRNKIVSQ